jgi:hypothetical protein
MSTDKKSARIDCDLSVRAIRDPPDLSLPPRANALKQASYYYTGFSMEERTAEHRRFCSCLAQRLFEDGYFDIIYY